ncbi:hypothetical protein [Rhodohalobacter sp. 8-1]|uniref:hypothetical protein n=1 Tax=Rhodohalobacter sp. 8-1 TaxID=3131972 RepID=UPI0030EB561D
MPCLTSYPHSPGFLLLLIIPLLLLGACDLLQSESEEDTECYLSKIQFNEFDSLKFRTISGGRVYSLKQELTVDGETDITASFQFSYNKESIRVVDQLNLHPTNPYMSVTLDGDDRPVEVIRFFNSIAVKLTHDISYPEENKIRVDLTREASTGDVLYVGYSNYNLDDEGNVIRLQQFRAEEDAPTQFTPMLDRFYTYDDHPNPQDGLYLPFFANVNFPTLTFFSSNNILSYTENGQAFTFDYEYGPDEEVIRQTRPAGNEILFGYANCSELDNPN